MGQNNTKSYSSTTPVSQSLGATGNQSAWKTSRTKPVGPARNSTGVWPRLVADQIHKMSQPLTALHGTVELALLSENTAEGYRAALEESLEQLIRLNGIVSSLRDLADADAQNTGPKSRVLSISVNRGPFEKATLAVEVPGRVRARKKSVSSPSVSTGERNTAHHRRDPQSMTREELRKLS